MSVYIKAGSAITYLQSFLERQTSLYQKSMDQLSTGNKYPLVGDNPIAVCTSAKLDVKIEVNNQASSNINLGKDMLMMVDEAQDNIISNLGRIHDLCIQASSETYSSEDKNYILQELRARLNYIDNAAGSTNFNNINLMDGSGSSLFLQIGSSADAKMYIGDALIDVHTNALGVDLDSTITGETWSSQDILDYAHDIEDATDTLLGTRALLGGYLNRLDFVSSTIASMNNNLIENKSLIMDTDTAEASAEMVKYQILQDASANILTQANQVPSWALNLLNR